MKSKRAEEYIDSRVRHASTFPQSGIGSFAVQAMSAIYAVDLAEYDISDKAHKAFCAVHCPKGCPLDNSEECGALLDFKQKMEE